MTLYMLNDVDKLVGVVLQNHKILNLTTSIPNQLE
jgi:hypothetical protein